MAKIEVCGAEIEVGGGALFLSVPGVGELWAETTTDTPEIRPFEVRWTETGSMLVEWGKLTMVVSPAMGASPVRPA